MPAPEQKLKKDITIFLTQLFLTVPRTGTRIYSF